jgi:signal peptidase I
MKRVGKIFFWLLVTGFVFVLTLVYVAGPQEISGQSMSPTLPNHTVIIFFKQAFRFRNPRRGEVVTFIRPGGQQDIDFISRVIALPGETVAFRDGLVYIGGAPISEPYLAPDTKTYPLASGLSKQVDFTSGVTVPAGQYLLLNDARTKTADSREWGFVPLTSLKSSYLFTLSKGSN